jgi:hypothetical protein
MRSIASPFVSEFRPRPVRVAIADGAPGALIAVKALIMLTTLTSLAVPAMHEFRGEAMTGRVLVYAVAVLLIPAGWAMRGRRSYPLAADSLLMVPLIFDLVGNSLHLYARFDHYDKVAHLVGLAASAMFAAALLRPYVSGRVALAAVAVAGGLFIGIAIELVEFAVFKHPSATGLGAYQDTVGDLAMDMLGAVIAAAVILALPIRLGRPRGQSDAFGDTLMSTLDRWSYSRPDDLRGKDKGVAALEPKEVDGALVYECDSPLHGLWRAFGSA